MSVRFVPHSGRTKLEIEGQLCGTKRTLALILARVCDLLAYSHREEIALRVERQ